MKISIITINFNNLQGLRRTVKSVISQTAFDKIEYIIIDGGSTDGAVEFLSTLPANIQWTSEKDRGISDAFNKGLALVTGDAIVCLNSGDCFINKHIIEKVINDWERSKVEILSYKVQVTNDLYIPSTDNVYTIYHTCTEPHQGTFVSKSTYDKVGLYSEEYKIRMDYHFFARCRDNGCSFKYINEVIVKYEEGGTSMKKENRIKFWREGMAVKFRYGLRIGIKDFIKFILYCKSIS